jgi:hypothetical protein
MKYISIKNWQKFQHYKDRCPPWIKLHRDLLRDYDFLCLQDASKLQLMLLWLLASQMNNKIPADDNFIKTQIGIHGDLSIKELKDKGFIYDASDMLAECKQSAIGETETETETETDAGKGTSIASYLKSNIPDEVLPISWGEIAYEITEWDDSKIDLEWDKFKDYWKATTKNRIKKDWLATWRNWCRNNKERKFKNG